jgi:virulence factor Mce-like protein
MSGTGSRPRVNPLLAGFGAGVALAFVVGLMASINLQYGAPWASTHTLTAQVTDADSIAVGSDVRIAGRLVGQVTAVSAARDHAGVTFHVDADDWPLPRDTTAAVRLATLLGQKYVQLEPGHDTAMLADNGSIPVTRTRTVVDFDQVLDTFDQPTRTALTSLLRTAAAAVQNQEGTLQQLAPTLSDLSLHSQVPTAELARRDPQLNGILVDLGITSAALDAARDDLAGNIDNLNSVTAALASDQGGPLEGFIRNTDALNVATDSVLGGGYATKLEGGLTRLSTFAKQLNSLLVTLIPQTASFTGVPPNTQPAADCRGGPYRDPCTPALASINLIYEIGSATSQSDVNGSPGNFFLRQKAQGVDPCGLIPCSGITLPGAPSRTAPLLPPLPAPPNLQVPTVTVPCIPFLIVDNCSSATPAPSLPALPSLPSLPVDFRVLSAQLQDLSSVPERYH